MQTTEELLKSTLTAVSARQTKASPINTKVWAEWLKLQTKGNSELEAMVNACAEFGLAFKEGSQPRWLSILGVTGTGKTHCAKRLFNHMAAASDWRKAEFLHGAVYWPGFVSELKAGDAYEKLRDMIRWPVLFLDDIVAERDTTGFSTEQLNMLLGSRSGKWTILTSNLMLDQIGAIEPRIADRIIREPNIFVEVNTVSHAIQARMPHND